MTDQRDISEHARNLMATPETAFNVTNHIGVTDKNSSNGGITNWQLYQQRLATMVATLSPEANKSVSAKQKQKGLLAIAGCTLKISGIGRRSILGTVVTNGPYNSVKFLTDNMPTPGHKMVAGLEHALVWMAYNLATRLQMDEDMPGIRHIGIINIFLHHGIVLRLHPCHRPTGQEVLNTDEARQLHRDRSDVGCAQGEQAGFRTNNDMADMLTSMLPDQPRLTNNEAEGGQERLLLRCGAEGGAWMGAAMSTLVGSAANRCNLWQPDKSNMADKGDKGAVGIDPEGGGAGGAE